MSISRLMQIARAGSGVQLIPNLSFTAAENGATIGDATYGAAVDVSDAYFGPNAYYPTMSVRNYSAGSFIYSGTANVNDLTRVPNKPDTYGAVFTGAGSASSPFSVVFDLGRVRVFNLSSYYQMFLDGKTTHAALDISSTGNLETRTSANWTQVHDYVLLDNDPNSSGVQATFEPQTSRYIRLRIYNDGRYGDGSYTELFHMKLFYDPI